MFNYDIYLYPAQCLRVGGARDRDNASRAARVVGKLRRTESADQPHADHEERREQKQKEGRRGDDREEIAARDDEHIPEKGGHAAASSMASDSGVASKPASTWRTIWTKASCSAGRAIDRPATPWPLAVMRARPIGVMKMVDQGEADDKVIAVHEDDPEYNHYRSIGQLPPHRMMEVQRFFEDYKVLERKAVVIEGFGNRAAARKIIKEAIRLYEAQYRRLRKLAA